VDRRRLIVVVDLLRGLTLAVLAVAILAGVATVPVIYAVVFLLGTGETVAGPAASARLPDIVLGTAGRGRLQAHFSDTTLLRAGLVIETSTHLILALTTRPWQAATTLVVFGAHATLWGVIAATLRQRSVPAHLRGRVNSANALIQVGGAALGSLLGGACAQGLGITVPFWIGGVVMTLITVAAWRPLCGAS
jgi:transmembrane secretion effector